MTAKKGNNKDDKQRNSFDAMEEIEANTIRAIESQKEWIEGSKEYLNQLEENSQKLTTEWITNAEKLATENRKAVEGQDYQTWFKKLEDIGHQSNKIAFLPGKTTLDILSKSTDQWKEVVEKTTEQNKKVVEQFTQSQKDTFQFFPFNPLTPNK